MTILADMAPGICKFQEKSTQEIWGNPFTFTFRTSFLSVFMRMADGPSVGVTGRLQFICHWVLFFLGSRSSVRQLSLHPMSYAWHTILVCCPCGCCQALCLAVTVAPQVVPTGLRSPFNNCQTREAGDWAVLWVWMGHKEAETWSARSGQKMHCQGGSSAHTERWHTAYNSGEEWDPNNPEGSAWHDRASRLWSNLGTGNINH